MFRRKREIFTAGRIREHLEQWRWVWMNKKDTTLDGGFSVSKDMAEECVGRCMKGRSER